MTINCDVLENAIRPQIMYDRTHKRVLEVKKINSRKCPAHTGRVVYVGLSYIFDLDKYIVLNYLHIDEDWYNRYISVFKGAFLHAPTKSHYELEIISKTRLSLNWLNATGNTSNASIKFIISKIEATA